MTGINNLLAWLKCEETKDDSNYASFYHEVILAAEHFAANEKEIISLNNDHLISKLREWRRIWIPEINCSNPEANMAFEDILSLSGQDDPVVDELKKVIRDGSYSEDDECETRVVPVFHIERIISMLEAK